MQVVEHGGSATKRAFAKDDGNNKLSWLGKRVGKEMEVKRGEKMNVDATWVQRP